MGKPVPYMVRRNIVTQPQILHRTHGKRQFSGFVGSFDTGQLQYMYRCNVKAPLKKLRSRMTSELLISLYQVKLEIMLMGQVRISPTRRTLL